MSRPELWAILRHENIMGEFRKAIALRPKGTQEWLALPLQHTLRERRDPAVLYARFRPRLIPSIQVMLDMVRALLDHDQPDEPKHIGFDKVSQIMATCMWYHTERYAMEPIGRKGIHGQADFGR